MADDFIAKDDYKYINFTKKDIEIIKRIKEYSKRNCRKEIETSYITHTLNTFDYGFSFFRTEILNKDKTEKIVLVHLHVLKLMKMMKIQCI